MGPGIIVPVVVLAVAVPVALAIAKRKLKNPGAAAGAPTPVPSARLTSNALRALPVPPWRVIYEIADDKLGGVEHVLIGPPGVFALQTSMEPLPPPPSSDPDARDVARAAIVRGALDDALRRCAMTSDRLILVHWGVPTSGTNPQSTEPLPAVTAVDGRQLAEWASRQNGPLSPAQVDLAWQTVLTAIGRPDPLA